MARESNKCASIIYMIQFVLSVVVALLATAGVSLAWPKFTNAPMPAPLTKVRDIVLQTSMGNQVANVLGTTTEARPPVNMQELAASTASDIVSGVEQKATEVVVGQMVLQLQNQIAKLPPDQQVKIKNIMCENPSP